MDDCYFCAMSGHDDRWLKFDMTRTKLSGPTITCTHTRRRARESALRARLASTG